MDEGPVAVTGASGKTGRAVVAALEARGELVRGLTHRSGDWAVEFGDPEGLEKALLGCRAVYHVPPNMHPAEDELSGNVIGAAEAAGVERFVLHSVLAPYLPAMPHHVRKAKVEARLRGSGLRWTILQPASYMQNLMRLISREVLVVPYSVQAPFTPVDLNDVAEVAAIVLTEPGHEYAAYELAGSERLDTAAMAEGLGRTARGRGLQEWQDDMTAAGTPPQVVKGLAKMMAYYDEHGLVGNSRVLSMLLGREPTRFAEAVARDLS